MLAPKRPHFPAHTHPTITTIEESIDKTTSGDADRNTVSNEEANDAVVDKRIK